MPTTPPSPDPSDPDAGTKDFPDARKKTTFGSAAPSGPADPGTADPFQDPEDLAGQRPQDVGPRPGTEPGEADRGPKRRAAKDIQADGSGSDAAKDGDRFDAG